MYHSSIINYTSLTTLQYSYFLTFNHSLYLRLLGACIVALGEKVGALYSADDSLRHGIEAAARRTDEGI